MRVHPVFSPDKLRRAAKTEPLTGQIADPATPIEVDDQPEWEVDEIVDVRLYYRKLQYKAKWIGVEHDNEWYPAGDFKNAPLKLKEFHDQYPDRPGPPLRLPLWLKAAEDDQFCEDDQEDGLPQPRG